LLIINLEIFGVILVVILVKDYPFLDEEYSWFYKNRDLNFWIVMLVFVVYLIMLIIEISYKRRLNFLLIILLYIILVRDLVMFFLYMR